MCIESPKKYNRRVLKALQSLQEDEESLIILGKGRNGKEQSVIMVERGKYMGFGFMARRASIKTIDDVRSFVKSGIETPTVRNLINSAVQNPKGAKVLFFE